MNEDNPVLGAFWSAPNRELQGAVVIKFEQHHVFWESVYDFATSTAEIWARERYSDRIEPGVVIHSFKSQSHQEALAEATRWVESHKQKIALERASLMEKVGPPVVVNQTIVAAWFEAHKDSLPNLTKARNQGTNEQTALRIDLAAMGFSESVRLSAAIARALLKTTISNPDRLNVWIVANWFHGLKLSEMLPRFRLIAAKKMGFSVTDGSLKMRLNRLSLTRRGRVE